MPAVDMLNCWDFESQSKRYADISTVRYGTVVKDDSVIRHRTLRDGMKSYFYNLHTTHLWHNNEAIWEHIACQKDGTRD